MQRFTTQWMEPAVGILAGFVLVLQCSSPPPLNTAKIPVEHEKLYIAPIAGLENLVEYPHWPLAVDSMVILLEEVERFREELLTEFHRNEKHGLYTLVDSTQGPTISVTVEILALHITDESLYMPLRMEVRDKAHDKRYYEKFEQRVSLTTDSLLIEADPFRKAAYGLAKYRRTFPYRKMVQLFCPPRSSP